ncbi:cupin domain-containing protein [Fimbriimonas ginsengisoli]|uniref:Cupin 2 conserved barrel domain-containing protein n=1 Tax=Fimbriimonas ginsengisoli Gsoil 348 TaxID=661478 RepID=A0A068NLQ8_FIMGI|nr:cupin domain-containing protein [Fimbriimonas ginsengisoli]AIE84352.1 Cupin 2 conserved barrel domain-containing protein [Fimbriimonas ginsengisoli Gsoil 348]
MVRHHSGGFRWESVDVHPYKEDGTHFKSITRQTLFKGADGMPVEFRYFEIAEGGHSTLERHEHVHLVMIIRGSGQVLVGDRVTEIGTHDVVHVPPLTWHQFRATSGEELGFLCVVSTDRDRPQRPGPRELEELNANEPVASFIRV